MITRDTHPSKANPKTCSVAMADKIPGRKLDSTVSRHSETKPVSCSKHGSFAMTKSSTKHSQHSSQDHVSGRETSTFLGQDRHEKIQRLESWLDTSSRQSSGKRNNGTEARADAVLRSLQSKTGEPVKQTQESTETSRSIGKDDLSGIGAWAGAKQSKEG